MVKLINAILAGILFIVSLSCSELFQQDEHHELSSKQHFAITNESATILSNNGKRDTLLFIGLIKAQYEVELYMGIHCKGPYDYREFERVYFALKQDTSLIKNKKQIQSSSEYYGYCRHEMPISKECIQFSFGYPKNNSMIKNSPNLTLLEGRNYSCSTFLDSLLVDNVKYIDVYKFKVDSINFRNIGILKNIYMTTKVGIVKIETLNNGDWIKTK